MPEYQASRAVITNASPQLFTVDMGALIGCERRVAGDMTQHLSIKSAGILWAVEDL